MLNSTTLPPALAQARGDAHPESIAYVSRLRDPRWAQPQTLPAYLPLRGLVGQVPHP